MFCTFSNEHYSVTVIPVHVLVLIHYCMLFELIRNFAYDWMRDCICMFVLILFIYIMQTTHWSIRKLDIRPAVSFKLIALVDIVKVSICSLALEWWEWATRLLVYAAETLQHLISSSKGHIWYLIEKEEEERLVLQKWAERTAAAEGSVSISHSTSPGQISTHSSLCPFFSVLF